MPCIPVSMFNSSCGENLGARNDSECLSGCAGITCTSHLDTIGKPLAGHPV